MRSDETLPLDMLIAAQKVREYTTNLTQDQFEKSRLHQSAVVRELQVIGEAARLISPETKAEHPQIQWTAIAGMRNRMIHEYFRVDLETVWATIQNDIFTLIEQLRLLVPPEEG